MVFFRNGEDGDGEPPEDEAGRMIPLLPLRDIVVFPHMVVPLFVGRTKSIQALDDAMAGSRELMLSAQRQAGQEEPTAEDEQGHPDGPHHRRQERPPGLDVAVRDHEDRNECRPEHGSPHPVPGLGAFLQPGTVGEDPRVDERRIDDVCEHERGHEPHERTNRDPVAPPGVSQGAARARVNRPST